MTGGELRRLRTEAEISQEALSRAVGVRALTVSRWERGLAAIKPSMEAKLRRVLEGGLARLDSDLSNLSLRAGQEDLEALEGFEHLAGAGKAAHWPMMITGEEMELVALLRQLSPMQRRVVLDEARALAARKQREAPVHMLNERGATPSQRRPK